MRCFLEIFYFGSLILSLFFSGDVYNDIGCNISGLSLIDDFFLFSSNNYNEDTGEN